MTALLSVSDEEASAAEEGRADFNMCGSFNPVWINGLNEMWFVLKRLTREYRDKPSFSEML